MLFADLHIHSRYSRATSSDMDLEHIALGAAQKGLDIVATGDFTHPLWLNELKSKLVEVQQGLFSLARRAGCDAQSGTLFLLSAEVCTISTHNNAIKRIHHLIYAPSIEVVEAINDRLSRFGELSSDGRPTLSMTPAQLVEEVNEVSKDVFIVPSHAWTPWFSVFGARSGFDSLSDAYEEKASQIVAIETGMSSDPELNWRISALDRITLISNSDSHSHQPWRLGRECNAFAIERGEASYGEIFSAIRHRDDRFALTIETPPAYGKYHWDGHRGCGFSCPPKRTRELKGRCPVCRRPLTIGVLHRIEQLADREEGHKPPGAVPFKRLLPLHELLATSLRQQIASQSVQQGALALLRHWSELDVLLNVSEDKLRRVAGAQVVNAILANRAEALLIRPGYDGVYGKIFLSEEDKERDSQEASRPQLKLTDFSA